PLSYRKKQEKEKRIQEAVKLAVRMQDRTQQMFTLAGILAFTDKVIDRETANKIRRAIEMTQVAMIFEEEKQQAVQQAVQQTIEAERKKAMDSQRQTIVKMIEKGYPTEEIMFLVSGCSKNEVDELRKKMQESLNGRVS
ncbi:MAG: hypothetical protein OSJ61_29095, partial [Lachnospiraceae bacterium]|nr:hypothetical protein [Lachnospiraceae bacterium]